MTDGLPPNQFAQGDVDALQEIVQQYADGKIERDDAVASLSARVASVCTLRQISFDPKLLLPYLQQLTAHDDEQKRAGDRRGCGSGAQDDGDNSTDRDAEGDEDEDEDECPRGKKRPLADRLSDAGDGDEGPLRTKWSKVDSSSFVWRSRAREFLDSMVFTPEHQDLLRQIEVYSQDPKGTVCDLLNTFDAPALPETQWKNVLLDRFVDFDAILTSSYAIEPEEPQQLVLGDAHLEVKKSKMVAKVSTHGQWINAFRIFEEAVNFAFEGRYRELRTYWTHINDLFSSRHPSLHARILNYDRAARVFVGQRRDILLSEVEKFRHVQDAHLLDGGIAVASAAPLSNGGSRAKPLAGAKSRKWAEVCRNYNHGRCRLGSECNYRHACMDCNGSGHPASECPDRARR
ncbi:hypothetical protein DFH07DRAFT_762113 [Mycena maculata]|uniref:C3H1-type domain-containing protein n=1 Tax=Mycena maculata TaxID=230809 RepID=A0AAD7HCG8_9AGAR|nr:hypothetical protein DFH07DRAFT_762113 [Mycena maculata]